MDETAIRDLFAERLVDRGLGEETARTIAAQLKPCVLLKLTYGWRPWRGKPGASRFGGAPDVPPNFEWPRSAYQERWGTRPNGEPYQLREEGGTPLTFVAQLNLAELHPHLPDTTLLPSRGLLSLFFDRREMPLGDDPDDPSGWRLFYFDTVDTLTAKTAPHAAGNPLKSCPIEPRRWLSLPADLTHIPGHDQLNDRAWAAILDEAQRLELDSGVYRMFGHAGTIKEPMEPQADRIRRKIGTDDAATWTAIERDIFESESREKWHLLIQFPTDFRAGVDWCEAGTLFVWIHRDDLAARRFDKVWMTWQVA
jgi:uncharacterized protein YwqG